MMTRKKIAVAKGDGIGSEIMEAVIKIFEGLQVPIDYDYIEMGRSVFLQGHKLGMTPEAKQTVEDIGLLFKGPMETPKGGGNNSINVSARKMWGTFANTRVFKILPGVDTIYSKAGIPINLTIMRENIEDTYGGVEYLVNADLAISKRFISAPGSYQIHKYSFEYAKQQGIKNITCGHKANIMKLTDGMFLEIFYEVAKDYPDITANDIIIDDLCMKLVVNPQNYELIVLPNLQGDIVSDLCAGLVGGLGFAPSANIGNNIAIFEAVHGTAPDIAGKGLANPTALLLSGLMMLRFLGFNKHAKKIEIAITQTLKDKIHTADLKISDNPVSTQQYADEILKRALLISDDSQEIKFINNTPLLLGKGEKTPNEQCQLITSRNTKDECFGVDISIESSLSPELLGKNIEEILSKEFPELSLELVASRGINVYPNIFKYAERINSYLIRITAKNPVDEGHGLNVANSLAAKKYKLLGIDFLRFYEGKQGYTNI